MKKAGIKSGEMSIKTQRDQPIKTHQKDTSASWTVKFSKAKIAADSNLRGDIAIPTRGFKSHSSIDDRHRIIRGAKVAYASTHDGTPARGPDRPE